MQIYILRDNQQTGPFTEAEVRAQMASGVTSTATMAWWDGLPVWTPLSQTPLAAVATTTAFRAPVTQGPPPIAGNVPLDQKTSGMAITSLVLGCISVLFSPLGIGAIITGHLARAEIRKDPSLTGKGMALAGLILGYFFLVLFIAIVVISVLIALGNQVKQAQISTVPLQVTINAAPVPSQ